MTDKSFDLSDIATGEKVFIVFTGVPKVVRLEGNQHALDYAEEVAMAKITDGGAESATVMCVPVSSIEHHNIVLKDIGIVRTTLRSLEAEEDD